MPKPARFLHCILLKCSFFSIVFWPECIFWYLFCRKYTTFLRCILRKPCQVEGWAGKSIPHRHPIPHQHPYVYIDAHEAPRRMSFLPESLPICNYFWLRNLFVANVFRLHHIPLSPFVARCHFFLIICLPKCSYIEHQRVHTRRPIRWAATLTESLEKCNYFRLRSLFVANVFRLNHLPLSPFFARCHFFCYYLSP